MENKKREAQRIAWSVVLPVGSENAINSTELCGRLGFSDDRALRSEIMAARLSGCPICSTTQGYYLPDIHNPKCMEEDISLYIRVMKARAHSSLKQVTMMEKWKAEQLGKEDKFSQMSIDEFLREEEREARGIG